MTNPAASSGSYQLTVTHFDPPTPGPCAPLDIDGDGTLAPLTDGVLLLRYLFGFTGNTLTIGALGMDATRDAAAIVTFLGGCGATSTSTAMRWSSRSPTASSSCATCSASAAPL